MKNGGRDEIGYLYRSSVKHGFVSKSKMFLALCDSCGKPVRIF